MSYATSFLISLLLGIPSTASVARAQAPAPPPASAAASSGTSYVIELQQTRVLFQDDGRGKREVTLRVKVLNEQAVRRWGQIALSYAGETEDLAVELDRGPAGSRG